MHVISRRGSASTSSKDLRRVRRQEVESPRLVTEATGPRGAHPARPGMRRMTTITTLIRGPGRPDRVLAPGLHEPQHRRSVEARGDGVAPRKPRGGPARRARGAKGCDADGRRPIHSAPSLTMVSGSVSDFVHGSIGRSVDNTEPRISRSALCCPRARTPSRQPRNAFLL